MTWGSLGPITFRPLAGPLDESWKAAVELAEHPHIGRKPTHQLTNLKAEELTLRVRLDATLGCRPDEDVAAWRTSMEAGEVMDLVLGSGDSGCYAGQWLIASLETGAVSRIPGGGKICHLELTVTLREWTAPADLIVSKRKAPAIKTQGKAKPTVASGPGYEGGQAPGSKK